MSAETGNALALDFPIEGECWVLRPPGHGRWAFDVVPAMRGTGMVAAGGLGRYLTCRVRSRDVTGWDRPVRAPVPGAVAASHDGEPDADRLVPWRDVPAGLLIRPLLHGRRIAAMAGNHVILGGPGGYVLLAHLRRDSVLVRPGDAVAAGQEVGRIGSSGNALGPHLHLQVMPEPDPLRARPVPFTVRRLQVRAGGRWQRRDGEVLPARRSQVRVGPP